MQVWDAVLQRDQTPTDYVLMSGWKRPIWVLDYLANGTGRRSRAIGYKASDVDIFVSGLRDIRMAYLTLLMGGRVVEGGPNEMWCVPLLYELRDDGRWLYVDNVLELMPTGGMDHGFGRMLIEEMLINKRVSGSTGSVLIKRAMKRPKNGLHNVGSGHGGDDEWTVGEVRKIMGGILKSWRRNQWEPGRPLWLRHEVVERGYGENTFEGVEYSLPVSFCNEYREAVEYGPDRVRETFESVVEIARANIPLDQRYQADSLWRVRGSAGADG
ncbi:hypothetical protein BSQ44_06840 [Aquibium oceanicum]|uniref:Uncharacterized protein n=2 Tax=Aquibium oceanicum TaxID=1670800 RepID=A0A1L3SNW5_9HYPH|nr:hypothetical protein BSQ44_06840 [Aquibium oceanicum]